MNFVPLHHPWARRRIPTDNSPSLAFPTTIPHYSQWSVMWALVFYWLSVPRSKMQQHQQFRAMFHPRFFYYCFALFCNHTLKYNLIEPLNCGCTDWKDHPGRSTGRQAGRPPHGLVDWLRAVWGRYWGWLRTRNNEIIHLLSWAQKMLILPFGWAFGKCNCRCLYIDSVNSTKKKKWKTITFPNQPSGNQFSPVRLREGGCSCCSSCIECQYDRVKQQEPSPWQKYLHCERFLFRQVVKNSSFCSFVIFFLW